MIIQNIRLIACLMLVVGVSTSMDIGAKISKRYRLCKELPGWQARQACRRYEQTKDRYKKMSFDELYEFKKEVTERQDVDFLVRVIERLISMCTSHECVRALRIELADVFYSLEIYSRAHELYSEFVTLYPNSGEQTEYALMRAIACGYMQLPLHDRDQSVTLRLLEDIDQYLSTPTYQEYAQDVRQAKLAAEVILLRNEISTFIFNLRRGNIVGAEKRLEHIQKHCSQAMHGCAINIDLLRQYLLAVKGGNRERISKKRAEVNEAFGVTKALPQPQFARKKNRKIFKRVDVKRPPSLEVSRRATVTQQRSDAKKRF